MPDLTMEKNCKAAPGFIKILSITAVMCILLLSSVCHGAALLLTLEERVWLDEHKIITVGADPDSPPFEFIDKNGAYRGMSVDYLSRIGRELGITFKFEQAETWAALMENARQKKIDMVSAIVSSPLREEFLSFTTPWITVPGVVISSHECHNIKDLWGKTVAVVNDSIWDNYLSANAEKISLVRVRDLRTALELTATSSVTAMVGNMASATVMIHNLGIGNLRIVLQLDKKTELSFGVRKDWPLFVSILNKSLAAMDPATKKEIRHRWVSLEELPWWRNSSLQRTAFFIFIGFLAVLTFFIIWNHLLKQQVKKRSAALKDAHLHLIRAAKMESVGKLAAGVAHEVKNPLAIISMGAEFLAGTPNLETTEKKVLKDISDAVNRADQVIRGLLDYSHYSKLELRPGDLNEVITSALHLVDHEMKKRQIEVRTNLAVLPRSAFDFNRIQQVFINLFMNSAQAMEADGMLEITSGIHRVTETEAHLSNHYRTGMEVIRVLVRDTGPGIDADESEKVFDPFYTTKDVGQGTGLGLSESRNIMELNNGTLHLKNCKQPKYGACAVVMLPLEQEEKNEKNSTY